MARTQDRGIRSAPVTLSPDCTMGSEPRTIDAGTETLEQDDIVPADEWDRFHGKLADRLREIRARVPENYDMEVSYIALELHNVTPTRVAVTIDSEDWIGNEGEIGDRHFHIILREQGGLNLATMLTSPLGAERDYLETEPTTGDAWDRLCRDIERAR